MFLLFLLLIHFEGVKGYLASCSFTFSGLQLLLRNQSHRTKCFWSCNLRHQSEKPGGIPGQAFVFSLYFYCSCLGEILGQRGRVPKRRIDCVLSPPMCEAANGRSCTVRGNACHALMELPFGWSLRSVIVEKLAVEAGSLLASPSLSAPWCNWLTRRPLKAESSGSIPDDATN